MVSAPFLYLSGVNARSVFGLDNTDQQIQSVNSRGAYSDELSGQVGMRQIVSG